MQDSQKEFRIIFRLCSVTEIGRSGSLLGDLSSRHHANIISGLNENRQDCRCGNLLQLPEDFREVCPTLGSHLSTTAPSSFPLVFFAVHPYWSRGKTPLMTLETRVALGRLPTCLEMDFPALSVQRWPLSPNCGANRTGDGLSRPVGAEVASRSDLPGPDMDIRSTAGKLPFSPFLGPGSGTPVYRC